MSEKRIIIAGYGGQGILFMGKLLAEAVMAQGSYVTFLPAYGAEVRGGTANCMVVVSDKSIGSPFVDRADILVVMNEPSFERFSGRLLPQGLLIVNSSLVKKKAFQHKGIIAAGAFTDIALELGSPKVANMAALGCLIARTKLIDMKTVINISGGADPANKTVLSALNLQALQRGAVC